MTSREYLASQMKKYTTDHLAGISAVGFKEGIDHFLQMNDADMEGYRDPTVQRDLSIKFHWGHNHDFGAFNVTGRMGDRHLWLLATFMDEFDALPKDLRGKRVLDIGCWTGGTSLLLAAMGAQVVALEEVKKYADAANFLKRSFSIDNVEFLNSSLYDFTSDVHFGKFDYVLFAGVIYHLTDPILGARIAYNATSDGGLCLMESAGIENDNAKIIFSGSDVTHGGVMGQLNRGGWNWFIPSPDVMAKWMKEAGFVDVRHKPELIKGRAFAVGRRDHHRDMNRAGLSVPRIR